MEAGSLMLQTMSSTDIDVKTPILQGMWEPNATNPNKQ